MELNCNGSDNTNDNDNNEISENESENEENCVDMENILKFQHNGHFLLGNEIDDKSAYKSMKREQKLKKLH